MGLKSIESLSLVCLRLLQRTVPLIVPGALTCWLDGAARLGRESVTDPVLRAGWLQDTAAAGDAEKQSMTLF